MTADLKAKMFLANERGLDECHTFRSHHTFNFGKYFNEYKIPFGNLYVWNDDSLEGGHSVMMTVEENSYIILLPVVGAITYKDSLGNECLVNPGEMQIINLPVHVSFEISNPYENNLVNFIQLWIRSGSAKASQQPLLLPFNLDENINRLLNLPGASAPAGYPNCCIGQFTGREEAVYTMKDRRCGLFIFIIEGAFEVQGRLLHPRDGLAFGNVEKPIELEALSNDAIIFMVEVY